MKAILIATALVIGFAGTASATNMDCKKSGNDWRCSDGDKTYNVSNATSEANAIAAAIAWQEQSQEQSQSQSSRNSNSNTNTYTHKDESVSLSAPAGGGCSWGVNVGVIGRGGAGICGTTRNETAMKLAEAAAAIGNPCKADNRLAVALLLKAPLARGMKVDCN